MVLATSSSQNWIHQTFEKTTAFPQGKHLERPVYFVPPSKSKVASKNISWNLDKSVYGLHDASRMWFEKVCHKWKLLGAIQSDFYPCIFIWKKENGLQGILATHVDNFCISGGNSGVRSLICSLRKVCILGKVQDLPADHLRMKLTAAGANIQMNLSQYSQTISKYQIQPGLKADDDLDETCDQR